MRGLERIGEELDRAVRAEAARPRRLRGRRRVAVLAVGGLLGVGGIAVAATQLTGGIDPPREADVRDSPQPGDGRLAGLRIADPDGDAAWDLRLGQAPGGEVCTAVGQVVDDRFGIVGLDRRFRALPLGAGDTCSRPPAADGVVAGARAFLGRDARGARTVVAGRAGAKVTALRVTARGDAAGPACAAPRESADGPVATCEVARGPDGAFAVVLRGTPEDLRPELLVTSDRSGSTPATGSAASDEHVERIPFADTGRDEVADLAGGLPWAIEADPPRDPATPDGLHCAQAARQTGKLPFGGPLTPVLCGYPERDDIYVAVRRFVPSGRAPADDAPDAGFPFGLHPARVLVFGGVADDVVRVEVLGDGVPKVPRIFRPHGGFLVPLDGRVDPAALTVRITKRDGTTRDLRGSTNLRGEQGQAIQEPPTPAWRSVADAQAEVPGGFAVADTASVRTSNGLDDPAGGPKWALRSWRAKPDPRARFGPGGPPEEFVCFQTGRLVDGTLREPVSGRELTLDREGDGFCNEPRDAAPGRFPADVVAYADRDGAYAPDLTRVVVRGYADGAERVEILGAGDPRPATVSEHGAYLALLDPDDVTGPLQARIRTRDGRTVTTRPDPRTDVTPGDARVDARAPDPDGGPPYAAVIADASGCGKRSLNYGRLLRGRLAFIHAPDGSVRFGDAGCSGGYGRKRESVRMQVQPEGTGQDGPPTAAQVARRTLAGRTVIYGAAGPGAVEVELRTPRDVRVVRPGGEQGVFVVVFDGLFTGGEAIATARYRDGSTSTTRYPLTFR